MTKRWAHRAASKARAAAVIAGSRPLRAGRQAPPPPQFRGALQPALHRLPGKPHPLRRTGPTTPEAESTQ